MEGIDVHLGEAHVAASAVPDDRPVASVEMRAQSHAATVTEGVTLY